MRAATDLAFLTAADTPHAHARLVRAAAAFRLTEDPPAPLHRILALVPGDAATGGAAWPVRPLPPGGIEAMQDRVPYAVIDHCSDWRQGHVALVMTVANNGLPSTEYRRHLREHVALVAELFEPEGLDGYLVYAGPDFEWAWLHWPDAQRPRDAFASARGQRGPAHSRSFQHVLCASEPLAAQP